MKTGLVYSAPLKKAFIESQRRKLLRFCVKQLIKHRKDYPKFWVLPEEGISREILLHGYYEKGLIAAMVKLVRERGELDVCLDIGANIGNHSVAFSQEFRRVISAEPVPENAGVIRANLAANAVKNVELIEKGLSNIAKKLPLFDTPPLETNNGFVTEDSDRINENTRWIEVNRGDAELSTRLGPEERVTCVKIDVEGHEPLVIEGLAETLKAHKPLVFWEAFNREEITKSEKALRKIGYTSFYHLSTKPARGSSAGSLRKLLGKSYYLVGLDECQAYDGMNVAVWE